MTWSEVIHAYKETVILDDVTKCMFIIGAFVVVFFILYVFLRDYWAVLVGTTCIMLLIGSFGLLMVSEKEKNLREKWVNGYAIPFIEELPSQKIVVDKYSFTNEKSHSSFFTRTEDFKTVKIQGKDESGEPVDMVLNVKIHPTETTQKPYILYKKLEKNLPYKFEKGYYNATLFVPNKQ
jgi:hypothetical protein